MAFSAIFLGAGDASSTLGNAACVIEHQASPWLLIDCGHDALQRYRRYADDQLPHAIFITHLHFDHIAGLEQLYFQSFQRQQRVTLYVPVPLIGGLHKILHNTGLAEGRENIWDRLHLVPVGDSFWHQGYRLHSYPVRHHVPNTAFCLHLPGNLFFSGDTRPIPEILHHCVRQGEVIFHDCSKQGNPSHSGVDELLREYEEDVLARLMLYHYHHEADRALFAQKGLQSVIAGQRIALPQDTNVLALSARSAG